MQASVLFTNNEALFGGYIIRRVRHSDSDLQRPAETCIFAITVTVEALDLYCGWRLTPPEEVTLKLSKKLVKESLATR